MLLWLSGADLDTLAMTPRERRKFIGLGGIVLTTSVLAALSSTFALSTGARAPFPVALLVGVFWGLAIMNLDRWLVTATQRREKVWQNIVAALPRVLMAIIIGAVISTPLVLWIFDREVEAELNVIHQRRLDEYQRKLLTDSRFAVIPELEKRIAANQPIADGTSSSAAEDETVKRLQAQYDELDKRYQDARTKATCEFDGTCGTGDRGDGPAYQQKLQAAEEIKRERDEVKQRLDQARADAAARQKDSAASERATAAEQVRRDRAELDRLKSLKKLEEDRFAADTKNDRGLLARLGALSELTGRNGTLKTAYLMLLLFITTIEVLPVLVKVLMNLGPPTTYDEILAKAERTDVESADAALEYQVSLARFQLQEDRRREEAATRDKTDRMIEVQGEVQEREVRRWRSDQLTDASGTEARGSGGARWSPTRLLRGRRAPEPRYAPWPEEEDAGQATARATGRSYATENWHYEDDSGR